MDAHRTAYKSKNQWESNAELILTDYFAHSFQYYLHAIVFGSRVQLGVRALEVIAHSTIEPCIRQVE